MMDQSKFTKMTWAKYSLFTNVIILFVVLFIARPKATASNDVNRTEVLIPLIRIDSILSENMVNILGTPVSKSAKFWLNDEESSLSKILYYYPEELRAVYRYYPNTAKETVKVTTQDYTPREFFSQELSSNNNKEQIEKLLSDIEKGESIDINTVFFLDAKRSFRNDIAALSLDDINKSTVRYDENIEEMSSGTAKIREVIIETTNFKEDPYGDEIFKVVAEKPLWIGCEDQGCSDKKLIEFIYSNLVYPKDATKNKIEGKVYLQFVIGKDGSIREEKVVRDIGGGCGEAALDVVRLIKSMEIQWQPGRQRGRPVSVLFTLPVTFRLN